MAFDRPTASPGEGEAHLWLAWDARPPDGLEEILDADELERAAAYRRAEDRTRFLAGCGLVRVAAARYAGVSPDAVVLDRRCPDCGRPHGKPRLREPQEPALELSVSHSGALVAVAFARSPVGVDVERLDERLTAADVSRVALSAGEREELERANGAGLRHFLVYWTRKEAVSKAVGLGLRLPPDKVVVSAPEARPELRSWPLEEDPGSVSLRDLELGPDFVGALAVAGQLERVVVTAQGGIDGIR
jgi:4'-phosphopantetheinyl transferase